jgi:hypothetical protein
MSSWLELELALVCAYVSESVLSVCVFPCFRTVPRGVVPPACLLGSAQPRACVCVVPGCGVVVAREAMVVGARARSLLTRAAAAAAFVRLSVVRPPPAVCVRSCCSLPSAARAHSLPTAGHRRHQQLDRFWGKNGRRAQNGRGETPGEKRARARAHCLTRPRNYIYSCNCLS